MNVLVACELRPFEAPSELANTVVSALNQLGHAVEFCELPTDIYRGGDVTTAALIARSLVLSPENPVISTDLVGHMISAAHHIALVSDNDVHLVLADLDEVSDARHALVECVRQCSLVLCQSEVSRDLLAAHRIEARVVEDEALVQVLGATL